MELLNPGIGLSFWTLLIFLLLFFLLKKFAWKPILGSIKAREDFISESINDAKKAKEELEKINQKSEELIKKASRERDAIISEAKEMNSSIVAKAKAEALKEATKIKDKAKKEIEQTKNELVEEMKLQMIHIATDISEKVLMKRFESSDEERAYMEKLAGKVTLN